MTALVCVVVTVRRLSERAWRAFGPRLRDPDFAFGVGLAVVGAVA